MQSLTRPIRQSPLRTARALAALLLAVAVSGPVMAVSDEVRNPSGQAADSGKEPKCVHGCERWGKVCNVDPRGAYKCRRRCEKFGKICE